MENEVVVAKRGVGRPAHVPDEKNRGVVLRAAKMGLPQESIARILKIGLVTLRKHYKDELVTGSIEANMKVLETLYEVATDKSHRGCVSAAIFWTKVRSGWREVTRTEHTGADGQPIKAEVSAVSKLDATQMTPEQREALREIIRQQSQAQVTSSVEETEEDEYEDEEDEQDEQDIEDSEGQGK
jgi:hypothetical protein